jgi:hypothetical protein
MRDSLSSHLRVQQHCLNQVKLAVKKQGFSSQRSLAKEAEFSLAIVSNFLTGKPVEKATFAQICRRLCLDWQEIAALNFQLTAPPQDKILVNSPSKSEKLDTLPPYPNGAVPLGSPFYLERLPLEEQIRQEIKKPGALVRIKAPKEMGKTSLLLRMLDFAKQQGYRTVSLNLEQVDQAILGDLNQFLRWLCANAARQLQLKPQLDEYWGEDLGSKISCTVYIQDYLLESITAPIVLALDELNQIFEHPQVAKDFLPLLRSWYEEAKTLPIWQKLRLIVVHSTEIYVPLQLNQSPFNVGFPAQLSHFSLEEVLQLAQRYQLTWENQEKVKQLMELVGGHPALVQTALYYLSREEITMTQILTSATSVTGIYAHHLRRHWAVLEQQPELAKALDRVMSAVEPVQLDPILAYKLSSMGLLKQSGDKLVPGYELYRRYFLEVKSSISYQ